MAITKELKDLLSTICKDQKFENKPLKDYLLKIYDSHEAKEKIQAINVDLVEQRKKSKEEITKNKTDYDELKGKFELLEKNKTVLTDDQKKLLDKGISDETTGIMNSMNEKLKNNENALNLLTKQLKLSDENTKKAELSTKKENIKNSLTKSLNKVNIKEANKIKTALAIISSNDMVDIQEDKIVFGHKEDGIPFTFKNADELTTYIAEEHKYLVESSGNNGGGADYNRGNDDPNGAINYKQEDNQHVTRNQQVQNAVDRFDKYFK
jgi:hypothetical protein